MKKNLALSSVLASIINLYTANFFRVFYIGRARKKLESALPECAKKKAKILGEQINLLSPSKRDIALTECGLVVTSTICKDDI